MRRLLAAEVALCLVAVVCALASTDSNIFPYGAPVDKHVGYSTVVLKREGYEVLYDDSHGIARYVTYLLDKIGEPGEAASARPERSNAFAVDRETVSAIKPSAYQDCHISDRFDRGHMAPAYGIGSRYGKCAERSTFLMSNIVPQVRSLNRGVWRSLEKTEADWYSNTYQHLWVLTGPIYDLNKPVDTKSSVAVPTGFFKIMLVFADKRPVVQAFIFKNVSEKSERFEAYEVSVQEVERLTELDFFPDMPKRLQNMLEGEKPTLTWAKQAHR